MFRVLRNISIVWTVLATALAVSAFAHGRCGTMQAVESWIENKGKITVAAKNAAESCDAEDYYDSVYSRTTAHFQIFYVLKGPHATTEKFVDSLAVNLEKAWNLHVTKNKMRSPKGRDTTIHYQKPVKQGLYGVEVLEINLVRSPRTVHGSSGFCEDCFAITNFSGRNNWQTSEMMIDNDFMVVDFYEPEYDTLDVGDKKCSYWKSTKPIIHATEKYSYAEKWDKAIRVTAFHELYHAVQVRYLSPYEHLNFWFEASATGMEEVGAPEVNDYFRYIPEFLEHTGKPLDENQSAYGASLFFLYLYNRVDSLFDKSIWENFAKNPDNSFRQQFASAVEARKKNPQDVFQDFAERLAYSGKNSKAVDSSAWYSPDQPLWKKVPYTFTLEGFRPDSSIFAYNYYADVFPDLENYTGKASVLLFKDGHARLRKISSMNTLDSLRSERFSADSLLWIFSRFENPSPLPGKLEAKPLRAYPTPWRHGNLCFAPLPLDKKFIEVRNRRGDLIFREKYDSETLCLDENFIKSKMVPGVYRYRAGSSGKTKDLMIIY